MSSPQDIWAPHLAAGERIVWSASVSAKLVAADRLRQRGIAIAIFIPSAIVAALLAVVFMGAIAPTPMINPNAMLAPVYFAFAAAIGVLAISQLFKISLYSSIAAFEITTLSRSFTLQRKTTISSSCAATKTARPPPSPSASSTDRSKPRRSSKKPSRRRRPTPHLYRRRRSVCCRHPRGAGVNPLRSALIRASTLRT